jgi:hypothetical protein
MPLPTVNIGVGSYSKTAHAVTIQIFLSADGAVSGTGTFEMDHLL